MKRKENGKAREKMKIEGVNGKSPVGFQKPGTSFDTVDASRSPGFLGMHQISLC
jgi:hypothetical protein